MSEHVRDQGGEFLLLRAWLDAAGSDDGTRFLSAEWLAQRGDWRAAGLRWLAVHHKEPSHASNTVDWWHERSRNRRQIVLPERVWDLLAVPPCDDFPSCKEFASLDAALEALCQVIHLQNTGAMPEQ